MSALPAAYVDIWPVDGGNLSLTSNNQSVLSVSTFKDIWAPDSGSFEILLPPGGPYGPNVTPQWVDIITPRSLVVIGLQRSVSWQSRANIVMVGVVTNVTQDWEWRYGAGVRRVCRVTGRDFAYFFAQNCAYCDMLLRYSGVGVLPGAKSVGLAENGLVSGPPEQLANQFYNKIMAGTGGIMAGTNFNYDDTLISFSELVQTDFQPYPGTPIQIPCAWNYLALEGSWLDHFTALFPFPYFEFAVLTQEPPDNAQLSITGLPFFAPVSPVAIARPLPLPKFASDTDTLDRDLWDNLPIVTPDGNAIIALQQSYGMEGLCNFYALNPSYLNTLFGSSAQQNSSFVFTYASWLDSGSIQKYGYRPCITNIYWLADPQANQAAQNANSGSDFTNLISTLALVPPAFHQPVPLMAGGAATLNLRPDIDVGVKFAYVPDKAGTVWHAYVRSVSHNLIFGGQSTTTLGLTRGLPVNVYDDDNLLLAALQGKGTRVDGVYAVNGGATGLEVFNLQTASNELASLSTAFTTPGAQ